VINLTAGAGIQFAPVTAPTPPYVPSIRAIGTAVLGGLANVLRPTRVGELYPPEEDNVISDNDIYWNNYVARSSAPASAAVAAPVARAARAAAAAPTTQVAATVDNSSATGERGSAVAHQPKAARTPAARAGR
jgi:hypothetical protein